MAWSISLAKQTKKTNIKHNNREMSEKAKERNPHIDYTRSEENVYLVQRDIRDIYEREFGKALDDYNAKQKRADRKIKDYYHHIQASKKTALQQEMIIQVGDIDDFAHDENNKERANEVLLDWFRDFEERNPQLKIYNAVIHNDEASPHMHVNFVPVAGNYKRGLEKQVSFDRAIKQQDEHLDATRPFDDWREKETLLIADRLKERGIERKTVGTNTYEDVNDYKAKKQLEQELATLREIVPDTHKQPPYLKKETETVRSGFMKSDKQETGNVILTPEQYENVTRQIHAATAVRKDYDRLRNTDLAEENRELREERSELIAENTAWEKQTYRLERDIHKLESENSSLKAHINDLKQNLGVIYQYAKKTLQDTFKDFREAIDLELDGLGTENHFQPPKSSKRKEQDHDMEM